MQGDFRRLHAGVKEAPRAALPALFGVDKQGDVRVGQHTAVFIPQKEAGGEARQGAFRAALEQAKVRQAVVRLVVLGGSAGAISPAAGCHKGPRAGSVTLREGMGENGQLS